MNLDVYLGHFTQLFRPLHLYQGPCYVVAQVIPTMAATVLRCSLWRDICGSMGAFAALKAGQVPCYGTTWIHWGIHVFCLITYDCLCLSQPQPFIFVFPFFSFSEGWWHCNYLGQCWGGFRDLVWSSFPAAGTATQMSRCKCRCLPNIPIWCTGATIDARQAGGAIPPDNCKTFAKAGAWLTRVR